MRKFDTTLAFINSHERPSGYAAGENIQTNGYTTQGDRGGAIWAATGSVIAVSQDVIDLNDIKMSDASGNEFSLVGAGVIDLNALGGTSVAFQNIATAAGLTFVQNLSTDGGGTITENTDIATGGQTLFSTPVVYVIGNNSLSVFIEGLRQIIGIDYLETSTTSFTLISGATVGDEVQSIIQQTSTLSVALEATISVNTVDDMVNRAATQVDEAFNVAEYSTGNGGGGLWDAVLTSGVTPNTRNIVIGVADPLISFVLRIEQSIDYRQFGAVSDAVQILDASINIGVSATTLDSPSSNFTSAIIGQGIGIFDAAAGTASLFTTIASINSPTSLEITDAASTTVVSVKAQYGTDNVTQEQGVIDFVKAAGSGSIIGIGKFFSSQRLDYRADNCVYHYGAFTAYGANHAILDESPTTHQVTGVLGFGGDFNPLGSTNPFGTNVDFNGLAAVHANGVDWYGAVAHTGDGTRAFSQQANGAHGTGPNFENLKNVHFHDFRVFGDGLTHDGFDQSSSTDGQNMLEDCSITGTVEGCKRPLNNSPGSSSLRHVRTNCNIEVKDASVIAARIMFNKGGDHVVKAFDVTLDGILYNGPEKCTYDFYVSGSGASVNDAVVFADNGADTTNKGKVYIVDDGTGANKWTRALRPTLHDLTIESSYIDGAVLAISNAGFRTVYESSPVLKNFTTAITTVGAVQDIFASPIISLGTGDNPVFLFQTETVSPGSNFNPNTRTGLVKAVTLTENVSIANPSNAELGQLLSFTIIQDGTGGFTTTWNSNYKFNTAWSDTGNTAAKRSTVAFRSDGNNTFREAEPQSAFQ